MAYFSANSWEMFMMNNRMGGPSGWAYWALILCNFLAIQPLWFKAVRSSPIALFVVSMFVNVGMWLERYVIVVTSLHRDFLPSSWGMYYPTKYDWSFYIGTIGMFLCLMYLFVRVLPAISIFEVRTLVPRNNKGGQH